MSEFRLPRLPTKEAIVDAKGLVTVRFQQWWQSLVERIEGQENAQDSVIADIAATQAALEATQADLAAAVSDIAAAQAAAAAADAAAAAAQADADAAAAAAAAAQSDITDVQTDLTGYVPRNATAAWGGSSGAFSRAVFAAYIGQTVSNPPTQAEMQALDDQVKLQSQVIAALITDLKADVLQ